MYVCSLSCPFSFGRCIVQKTMIYKTLQKTMIYKTLQKTTIYKTLQKTTIYKTLQKTDDRKQDGGIVSHCSDENHDGGTFLH
jgi:hypothetical protein